MKKIIVIMDYKKRFGSKWDSIPYNSGMDTAELEKYFLKRNYTVEFSEFSKIQNISNMKNLPVIYTSSEDIGYKYKDFIEDVIYYLECNGANTIPAYKFLRANNNKVFMELLRKIYGQKWEDKLDSFVFGSSDELDIDSTHINFPLIVKEPQGAQSRGVYLASNNNRLKKITKRISRFFNLFYDVKDLLRPIRHKGYLRESLYRKKFIIQKFIPNLNHDWKVLIFHDKYFIFSRPTKKNDFRASGSGVEKYKYGSKCKYPNGIFDYARKISKILNTPTLSLDIAFDGESFHLLEFQALYFGTVGFTKSDVYFKLINNNWDKIEKKESLEEIYADSIVDFIENK